MSLKINCYRCTRELEKPGALIFTPPDEKDNCTKYHLCPDCINYVMEDIELEKKEGAYLDKQNYN